MSSIVTGNDLRQTNSHAGISNLASNANNNNDDNDTPNNVANKTNKSSRYCYDQPVLNPKISIHWQSLIHKENDEMIKSKDELLTMFKQDLHKYENIELDPAVGKTSTITTTPTMMTMATTTTNSTDINSHAATREQPNAHILIVALWSVIAGYCEAVTTHKDPLQRYCIFPIPIDALRRLVNEEFVSFIQDTIKYDLQQQEQQDKLNIEEQRKKNAVSKSKSSKGGKTAIINTTTAAAATAKEDPDDHRIAVRHISNAIWKKAQSNKSLNVKEELHANSLYVLLRGGSIDKKSLDCFGAALITIITCQYLGYNSLLTLSEDHAYECHPIVTPNRTNADADVDDANTTYDTCEVAIPGYTKVIQQKRGCRIETTIQQQSNPNLTPQTSWLYMRKNPIVCNTIPMMIAAIVGNINCTIGNNPNAGKASASSSSSNAITNVSVPLYQLKRDLLWCLYDGGSGCGGAAAAGGECADKNGNKHKNNYIHKFPFALIELGDCEDHCTSPRGETIVISPQLSSSSSSKATAAATTKSTLGGRKSGDGDNDDVVEVLQLEQLFLDAISSSIQYYNDTQTYPYFYAAHYHKDAGLDLGIHQEYRLVESLRLYAQAARVASTHYTYDSKDSLYLMKHMTVAASLIYLDILTRSTNGTATTAGDNAKTEDYKNNKNNNKKQKPRTSRTWEFRQNAIAAGTWLLGFYDSLFYWEEQCCSTKFVEICTGEHKYSLSNLFSTFVDQTLRQEIVNHLFNNVVETKNDCSDVNSIISSDSHDQKTNSYAHNS